MKTALTAIALLISLASTSQAKTLSCQSFETVDGWKGVPTHDYVTFTAEVATNEQLANAQISGAFVTSTSRSAADTKYTARDARYANYTRFSDLEDSWCWFTPFLPKQLADLQSGASFAGFVGKFCEGGIKANIALKCVIK